MSGKLNIVTIEGIYKIQCVDDCYNHISSNDILYVNYQGKNHQATIDLGGDPLSGEGNYYSLTFDGGDLSEYNISFGLRTVINGDTVVLFSDTNIEVNNILDGDISYDINFVYDLEILEQNEECTNPLAENYDGCATLDSGLCNYGVSGTCTNSTACT